MNLAGSKGLAQRKIFHNGVEREYLMYIPPSYSDDKISSIVLNFHGFGSTALDQLRLSDWRELSDENNFILIYPQGLELPTGGTHWNPDPLSSVNKSDSKDLGFIRKLLRRTSTTYSIDSSSVFATGFSNGADMAYGLATYGSRFVAGIAPVSGLMNEKNISKSLDNPVGVISFNGTNDWVRPIQGVEGHLASTLETSNYWAQVNNSTQSQTEQFIQDSGNLVERTTFVQEDGTATVQQYTINRRGHEWFDINIEGSNLEQLAWQFFSNFDQQVQDIISTTPSSIVVPMPSSFKRKLIDPIIGFNSSSDTLRIDADRFEVDITSNYAVGKNKKQVKKKLAKENYDFIYDQKNGGLYFNKNGSDIGFGDDGGIIAVLQEAPRLTAENFVFL